MWKRPQDQNSMRLHLSIIGQTATICNTESKTIRVNVYIKSIDSDDFEGTSQL